MNGNMQPKESSHSDRLNDLRRRASLAFGEHGNLPQVPVVSACEE